MRRRDQIRAKIGSNKGLTTAWAWLVLVLAMEVVTTFLMFLEAPKDAGLEVVVFLSVVKITHKYLNFLSEIPHFKYTKKELPSGKIRHPLVKRLQNATI